MKERSRRILRSIVKCKLCGDIIESKHRHDWVPCKCGEIFVDGGTDYVRCGANDLGNIEFLTEYGEELPLGKSCYNIHNGQKCYNYCSIPVGETSTICPKCGGTVHEE